MDLDGLQYPDANSFTNRVTNLLRIQNALKCYAPNIRNKFATGFVKKITSRSVMWFVTRFAIWKRMTTTKLTATLPWFESPKHIFFCGVNEWRDSSFCLAGWCWPASHRRGGASEWEQLRMSHRTCESRLCLEPRSAGISKQKIEVWLEICLEMSSGELRASLNQLGRA